MKLSRASVMQLNAVDGNFVEVGALCGPFKRADYLDGAVVNRNDDLRRVGVDWLAERTGESFVLGGKVCVVIRV